MPDGGTPRAGARVGPNAILRMAEALGREKGPDATREIFAAAGLAHRLAEPPRDMVPEDEPARLYAELFARLPAGEARRIARVAGELTGGYLLAHRIPKLAAAILRTLPRGVAARLLSRMIARNAWTFAGGGGFAWRAGPPLEFAVRTSPWCRHLRAAEPSCDYHAGVFERLFAALVAPQTRVEEIACAAAGAPECRFVVRFDGPAAGAATGRPA